MVGHSGDCSDGGVSAAIGDCSDSGVSAAIAAIAALACSDGDVGAIIVVAVSAQ